MMESQDDSDETYPQLSSMLYDEFATGDVVFVKIDGYPYWPAQITARNDGPAEEYCVAFFGSHEVSVVKPIKMKPYNEETVKKFIPPPKGTKPKVRAEFNVAVDELDRGVRFDGLNNGNEDPDNSQEVNDGESIINQINGNDKAKVVGISRKNQSPTKMPSPAIREKTQKLKAAVGQTKKTPGIEPPPPLLIDESEIVVPKIRTESVREKFKTSSQQSSSLAQSLESSSTTPSAQTSRTGRTIKRNPKYDDEISIAPALPKTPRPSLKVRAITTQGVNTATSTPGALNINRETKQGQITCHSSSNHATPVKRKSSQSESSEGFIDTTMKNTRAFESKTNQTLVNKANPPRKSDGPVIKKARTSIAVIPKNESSHVVQVSVRPASSPGVRLNTSKSLDDMSVAPNKNVPAAAVAAEKPRTNRFLPPSLKQPVKAEIAWKVKAMQPIEEKLRECEADKRILAARAKPTANSMSAVFDPLKKKIPVVSKNSPQVSKGSPVLHNSKPGPTSLVTQAKDAALVPSKLQSRLEQVISGKKPTASVVGTAVNNSGSNINKNVPPRLSISSPHPKANATTIAKLGQPVNKIVSASPASLQNDGPPKKTNSAGPRNSINNANLISRKRPLNGTVEKSNVEENDTEMDLDGDDNTLKELSIDDDTPMIKKRKEVSKQEISSAINSDSSSSSNNNIRTEIMNVNGADQQLASQAAVKNVEAGSSAKKVTSSENVATEVSHTEKEVLKPETTKDPSVEEGIRKTPVKKKVLVLRRPVVAQAKVTKLNNTLKSNPLIQSAVSVAPVSNEAEKQEITKLCVPVQNVSANETKVLTTSGQESAKLNVPIAAQKEAPKVETPKSSAPILERTQVAKKGVTKTTIVAHTEPAAKEVEEKSTTVVKATKGGENTANTTTTAAKEVVKAQETAAESDASETSKMNQTVVEKTPGKPPKTPGRKPKDKQELGQQKIQEPAVSQRRVSGRKAEAPSRFKEMIISPKVTPSLIVPSSTSSTVESSKVTKTKPNAIVGKSEIHPQEKLAQTISNGTGPHSKKIVVATIVKSSPLEVPRRPSQVAKKRIGRPPKRQESVDQNSSHTLDDETTRQTMQFKAEIQKLSRTELNEKIEERKAQAERINLIIDLMDSASLNEYKCEEAYDLLVQLGSKGYIDSKFLKDFPETVEVVKKMRHYVGNPKGWKMNKIQREQLDLTTAQIREAADTCYENFKSLFQTGNTKPLAVLLMEQQMNRLTETESLNET